MKTVQIIQEELERSSDRKKAVHLSKYFKAIPGGYGEGDRFMGVTVPSQRRIARKHFRGISLEDTAELLQNPFHECRLTALFILVYRMEHSSSELEKEAIVQCYLDNLSFVNNWDLVDSSAYKLLGPYLENKDRSLLYELAESRNFWEQRIAVIATLYFIRNHDFSDTLAIAEKLIDHPHDLIHKATGWMLREVGNRDLSKETAFLDRYHQQMNRTMLRYAVEKFEPELKKKYLRTRNAGGTVKGS